MKKCEERQERILQYMKETIRTHGFPPTVREICAALDIKSTSTVFKDLNALQAKGAIRKDPTKPRALVVVDDELEEAAPEQDFTTRIDDTTTTLVPIIGRVAAGTPILSEENVEEYVPFPSRFLGTGNNFILNVHGTSMINAGINDGDYIIVKEEHEANNGDIVVAMIQGEYEAEATVKRYYRESDHIRLQPENDAMDPIIVKDCVIVGKVEGVFRYLS
jgi:repressor LexA